MFLTVFRTKRYQKATTIYSRSFSILHMQPSAQIICPVYMKQKPIKWSLLLSLALLHTSCTALLFIEKAKPAEVNVTNDQWKVVALNRFNPDLLPFTRDKKTAAFHNGAQHAFSGVLDAILADSTFSLEFADSAAYRIAGSGKKLTPEHVQGIYLTHPHHLLLTLDHFDTYMEPLIVSEEGEDGEVSITAHYTLFTKSSWTLYDSTGTVLDSVILSLDEHYLSRDAISGLLAMVIKPSIGKAGTTINTLASYTGQDYWQRLSPQSVTLARPYYSTKNLQPAASSMAAEDWDKAIVLLKPLAEGQSRKEAARAAYNLAVVYEAIGDLTAAKRWAKIASAKKEKLAMQLLTELERY